MREREDWFNVLMASETGEGDARALPLPPSLAEALIMRLGWGRVGAGRGPGAHA